MFFLRAAVAWKLVASVMLRSLETVAMQPVLLQHNCGCTAFPFESCRSPATRWFRLGPGRSEAAEFSPRTNVSSSPLLSFRSSRLLKKGANAAAKDGRGWRALHSCPSRVLYISLSYD